MAFAASFKKGSGGGGVLGGTWQFLQLEITFKLLFINRGTVELHKSHQHLNRSVEYPE